ncbi:hypothetical protein ACOSP7_022881 [Xanthoceras sorbifolium]
MAEKVYLLQLDLLSLIPSFASMTKLLLVPPSPPYMLTVFALPFTRISIFLSGISMVAGSYMATLHHQLAYRLQDHAIDLPIPGTSSDTLYITAEREDKVSTITQIPRHITRDKLLELMPLEWITNYEKLYQDTSPVQIQEPNFTRLKDGSVKTTFQPIQASADPTPVIFQSMMITPVAFEYGIHVHLFHHDGSVTYTDKINGHFI